MTDHPVRLVDRDDLRRSRLTVLLRLPLALPHYLWSGLWSIPVALLAPVAWLAVLLTGRLPRSLHAFYARFVRHNTHAQAYFFLVANPFPPFGGGAGAYPVDLHVEGPRGQHRLVTLLRLLLALPAYLFVYVMDEFLQLASVLNWFAALALGRSPRGIRDFSAFCIRYEAQTYGYMLLLTDRYPTLRSRLFEPMTTRTPAATQAAPEERMDCPACGAEIAYRRGEGVVTCPSCGGRVAV